jgi:alpha-N-arabinofuranosidase
MASYAPLLVNISPNAMQWDTDLIGYDAQKSYGSPSYYAQVMFGSYIGDTTPVSSVEGAGSRFFYSVTEDTAKKKLYLKLVNASSDAQAVDVKLPGTKLAPVGKLISLTGRDPESTNTMEKPTAIAPVTSTLPGVGADFHHKVPAYTIEVVELDVR